MLSRIASVLALGLSLALVTTHAQELQPGDIIDEIDGQRADEGNVADVRLALARRGEHVLELRRLGRPLTVTIQTPELRDLR